MKLILTHEVTGLGEPGDVVEVKDGYGRNFLLPRNLATGWTKGAQKQIDSIRAGRAARAVHDLDGAQAIRGRLSELTVSVPAQAGDSGRLFGSLSASDIVDAVTAAGGPSLDKRRIETAAPIRTLGAHTVSVRLHPEVVGVISLDVVARATPGV